MKTSASYTAGYLLASISMVLALFLWFKGFAESPLMHPQKLNEIRFLNDYLERNRPDLKEERDLAQSYWLRYPDVREDPYWGENGPMGIWGPRDHYTMHGKREGRIYQLVLIPDDLDRERALAEAYWNRYPDIHQSSIWGEKSSLGILGPRDHYRYIGSQQGRLWGMADEPEE